MDGVGQLLCSVIKARWKNHSPVLPTCQSWWRGQRSCFCAGKSCIFVEILSRMMKQHQHLDSLVSSQTSELHCPASKELCKGHVIWLFISIFPWNELLLLFPPSALFLLYSNDQVEVGALWFDSSNVFWLTFSSWERLPSLGVNWKEAWLTHLASFCAYPLFHWYPYQTSSTSFTTRIFLSVFLLVPHLVLTANRNQHVAAFSLVILWF